MLSKYPVNHCVSETPAFSDSLMSFQLFIPPVLITWNSCFGGPVFKYSAAFAEAKEHNGNTDYLRILFWYSDLTQEELEKLKTEIRKATPKDI